MNRNAATEKAAALQLRKAVDRFLAEFDKELAPEDEDHLAAVRRLADDMTRPLGDVGTTGPG